jgi:hypothetical protein
MEGRDERATDPHRRAPRTVDRVRMDSKCDGAPRRCALLGTATHRDAPRRTTRHRQAPSRAVAHRQPMGLPSGPSLPFCRKGTPFAIHSGSGLPMR